jgi:predicted cation transporter
MTDTALTHIQTRLQRVERQNHVLIALLCAAAGLATLAATKHGPTVITVDEVRAHRISLLDDGNAIVHTWRGGVSGSYFED